MFLWKKFEEERHLVALDEKLVHGNWINSRVITCLLLESSLFLRVYLKGELKDIMHFYFFTDESRSP